MTDLPPTVPPTRSRIPLPDTRGWAALGLFALTAMIFWMIDDKPTLTANQGFMFLAQAVIVSGLIGGVIAFLFSASKSAQDAAAKPPEPPIVPPAP
jgi:hypothetical protein